MDESNESKELTLSQFPIPGAVLMKIPLKAKISARDPACFLNRKKNNLTAQRPRTRPSRNARRI